MSTLSVSDSLKAAMITPAMRSLISSNKDMWVGFGKKNSHILRSMLFKLFASSKLSKESIIWVYFFHSIIKDRERILMAISTLPDAIQNNEDIKEAVKFMRTKMVKYTKDETASKFASVHLPNTNPAVDIVLFLISLGTMKHSEAQDRLEVIFNDVMARTTMTQIRIDTELQTMNEELVKNYWEKVVVYKNREERLKNKIAVGFVKEYYDTAAADTYELIDENFKAVSSNGAFYTRQEVIDYVYSVITWEEREAFVSTGGNDDDSTSGDKKGKEKELMPEKEKDSQAGPSLRKAFIPSTPRPSKVVANTKK